MKVIPPYTPLLSKAHSWDDLLKFFTTLFDGQYEDSIAALILHIKASGLDKRLYGLSSLDRLIVSNDALIQVGRETIFITFDRENQTWQLKYSAMPFNNPEWVRTYSKNLGIKKFDQLIELLKW